MQSNDDTHEFVTSMDSESSKRAAVEEHTSVESKRLKLVNGSGDSGDNGANGEKPTTSDEAASVAASTVHKDQSNSATAAETSEPTKSSNVVEPEASLANTESSSKASLPGAQSEVSVVVISEGDEDANNGDDDDDDCQIVGVSHRVPAMPRSDIEYVQHLRDRGLNPRDLLSSLLGTNMSGFQAPEEALWQLLARLVSEPARRRRLENVSTLDDVVVLLSTCQRILVLTGAGVSVSCGIPDFRSRDGIYARLASEYPELPDPQSMFDIHYFKQDQRPFFKFAKEIYPGQFKPSPSHRFIKALEERGQLLRNYSQNIDTLERAAGIERVLNCHGSFATASCMRCKFSVDSDTIKADIMDERVPMCPKCASEPASTSSSAAAADASASTSADAGKVEEQSQSESEARPPSVLKPDIVFFGESLPAEFYDSISQDEGQADLLIVIGSSLKVQPVSLIPSSLPGRVPQILINREPLHQHNFDVCLLGDCDRIVAELCRRLGWEGAVDEPDGAGLREIPGEELLDRRQQAYAAKDAEKPADDAAAASGSAPSSSAAAADAGRADADDDNDNDEAAKSSSATPHEDDCNLSAYLPPGTFARFGPNKYVFPGAEAHPDEICSDEEEQDEEGDDEDDEDEDYDDDEESEYDDEELSDYDDTVERSQQQVVVNLVSSEEENEAEEDDVVEVVEEENSSGSSDQGAESTSRKVSPLLVSASSLAPIESAKPVHSVAAESAAVIVTSEIGDAEEDELLNCDVD